MKREIWQPDSTGWLDLLAAERRAGRLASPHVFWVAAERLAMVQTIYPGCSIEPPLVAPRSRARTPMGACRCRSRASAGKNGSGRPDHRGCVVRSLPVASPQKFRALFFALEAEGFILRGQFHPGRRGDRMVRPAIAGADSPPHIQQAARGNPACFDRRVSAFFIGLAESGCGASRLGVDGLEACSELLDGCELPAAAWEPEVLGLRVGDYVSGVARSALLHRSDRMGSVNSCRRRGTVGLSAPVRSSPISLFARENLPTLACARRGLGPVEFSPDAQQTLETLLQFGALFFGEIVRHTRLLPSRVEQALAELAAYGYVTADGFEGLRALLLPEEKRAPFGGASGGGIIKASQVWNLADDGRCCEERPAGR